MTDPFLTGQAWQGFGRGFTACTDTMRAEPYEHNNRWQGWQHI